MFYRRITSASPEQPARTSKLLSLYLALRVIAPHDSPVLITLFIYFKLSFRVNPVSSLPTSRINRQSITNCKCRSRSGRHKVHVPYPCDLGTVKHPVSEDIDQYSVGSYTSCGYGHYGCVTTLGNYFCYLAQLKWTKEVLQLLFACYTTLCGW